MLAKAVTRTWQASLNEPQPVTQAQKPQTSKVAVASSGGWQRPRPIGEPAVDDPPPAERIADERPAVEPEVMPQSLYRDEGDEDPEIRFAEGAKIVPRRPGIAAANMAAVDMSPEGIWSSHLFWKGVVAGAAMVLLVKTVIAVQAPLGIAWYGF